MTALSLKQLINRLPNDFEVKFVCGSTEFDSITLDLNTTVDHNAKLKLGEDNQSVYRYVKAKEVMELLDITRQTLCNYVKTGKIEAVKQPGGQYLYKVCSKEITSN